MTPASATSQQHYDSFTYCSTTPPSLPNPTALSPFTYCPMPILLHIPAPISLPLPAPLSTPHPTHFLTPFPTPKAASWCQALAVSTDRPGRPARFARENTCSFASLSYEAYRGQLQLQIAGVKPWPYPYGTPKEASKARIYNYLFLR